MNYKPDGWDDLFPSFVRPVWQSLGKKYDLSPEQAHRFWQLGYSAAKLENEIRNNLDLIRKNLDSNKGQA